MAGPASSMCAQPKQLSAISRQHYNLEIFYIVSFEPATICDLVTGLNSWLGALIVVDIMRRWGIVFFQTRRKILGFIEI